MKRKEERREERKKETKREARKKEKENNKKFDFTFAQHARNAQKERKKT